MTIREFGEALIRTGDLDPVYVALRGADLQRDQLRRLLTAYWCFYHLGAAALISEKRGGEYWRLMLEAARNASLSPAGGRWPRAAERRHFRGEICVRAVEYLARCKPEYWVESLEGLCTDDDVMRTVRTWPLHGPWVAFKAADMMERVVGVPIKFSGDLGLVYTEPRAGLDLLVSRDGGSVESQYSTLLGHFSRIPAPPDGDRGCGPQEVETVLCKWKSHVAGRYAVGKDVREVRHVLAGWGRTASRLLSAAPEEVQS